ncbi:MAG: hypothetical protein R3Y12_01820 [Clostridia bacterium]
MEYIIESDVIKIVEQLTKRDWLDYLIAVVPLIFSTVAIGISIATSQKQNRIALFEKRYEKLKKFKELYLYGVKTTTYNYVDGVIYADKYNKQDFNDIEYLFSKDIWEKCNNILYALLFLNEVSENKRTGVETLISRGATEENIKNKIASFENFENLVKEMEEYLKL